MSDSEKKGPSLAALGDLKKELTTVKSQQEKDELDKDKILQVPVKRAVFLRYKASKMTFILSSILFFTNTYLLGARFSIGKSEMIYKLSKTLFPYSYVFFVLSICIFGYYYTMLKVYHRRNEKIFSLALLAIFGLLALTFLITFIFDFSTIGK